MPAAAICLWVVSAVPVYLALQDLNANIILMIVILIHAKMVPNVLTVLMVIIASVFLVLLVTPVPSKKTPVTMVMVLLNIANKIVPCLVLIQQEVITSATAKMDMKEKTVSWILMNVCLPHVNMEETAATPMEILIVPAKMDGRERHVNRLEIFAIRIHVKILQDVLTFLTTSTAGAMKDLLGTFVQ